MAKKVLTIIKLQIPGGQANPAPPVGPALGQHGVNIMEFTKAFNAQTAQENGRIIPVEITVYEDRSFDFITKTPPAAVLIKEALRLEKGSAEPNRGQVDGRRGGGLMSHHGKRYRTARGEVDREQLYTPVAAIRLLKDAPAAKFDETVEVHMNLGLNVRHADEQLRGTMMLPHGTGREARVAVFAEGDKAREAEEAGADVVGSAASSARVG